MKSFLVVLLAVVFATAVTAAPSSPNFSLEETGLNLEFFSDTPEQLIKYFTCINEVVTEIVAHHEFKPVWDPYSAKLEEQITVKFPKCNNVTCDCNCGGCKVKCQKAVVNKIEKILNEFAEKVTEANQTELGHEIEKQVSTRCVFFREFQAPVPNSFLARFECVAKALEKVSKAHGLQSLWEKSQPKLAQHLAKWKHCKTVPNAVFRYICEAKEGASSFVLITEYAKSAASKDSKFTEAFGAEYKKSCM